MHTTGHRLNEGADGSVWCKDCGRYVLTPFTVRSLACMLTQCTATDKSIVKVFVERLFTLYATLEDDGKMYKDCNNDCVQIITMATDILKNSPDCDKRFPAMAGIDSGWFVSGDLCGGWRGGGKPLVWYRYLHAWLYEELTRAGQPYAYFETANETAACENMDNKLMLIESLNVTTLPGLSVRCRFAFREAFGKCLLCGNNTGTAKSTDYCLCGAAKRTLAWANKIKATGIENQAKYSEKDNGNVQSFILDYTRRVFVSKGANGEEEEKEGDTSDNDEEALHLAVTQMWDQLRLWLGTAANGNWYYTAEKELSSYEKHYVMVLCTHLCFSDDSPADSRAAKLVALANVWVELGVPSGKWTKIRNSLATLMNFGNGVSAPNRFTKVLNEEELLLAMPGKTPAILMPGVPRAGCYGCQKFLKNAATFMTMSQEGYECSKACGCLQCGTVLPTKEVSRGLLQRFDLAVAAHRHTQPPDDEWYFNVALVIDIFNSMVDGSIPLIVTTYDSLIKCAKVERNWDELAHKTRCARQRTDNDIAICSTKVEMTFTEMKFLNLPFTGKSLNDGINFDSEFLVVFLTCWAAFVAGHREQSATTTAFQYLEEVVVNTGYIQLLAPKGGNTSGPAYALALNLLSMFPVALNVCLACGQVLNCDDEDECRWCENKTNAVRQECLPFLVALAKQNSKYEGIKDYYAALLRFTAPAFRRESHGMSRAAGRTQAITRTFWRSATYHKKWAFPALHLWISVVNYCVYKNAGLSEWGSFGITSKGLTKKLLWELMDSFIPDNYFSQPERARQVAQEMISKDNYIFNAEKYSVRGLIPETTRQTLRDVPACVDMPPVKSSAEKALTVASVNKKIATQHALVKSSREDGDSAARTIAPALRRHRNAVVAHKKDEDSDEDIESLLAPTLAVTELLDDSDSDNSSEKQRQKQQQQTRTSAARSGTAGVATVYTAFGLSGGGSVTCF